jgi:Secretion system C-terminal sorting domain
MIQKLLSLLCVLSGTLVQSQCPTDPIVLTTQEAIDNFAANYPNCTMLTNDFKVDGETNVITNLNGLAGITHAGDFYIMKTDISDFSGLENLLSTEHMSLGFNENIQDLSGLSSLQSVEEINIWYNSNMTSLNGAGNLNSVIRLNLFQNYSLQDISELSDLQSLTSLSIAGNGLTSLAGLENIQTIVEDIFISNEAVSNFNDLSSLTSFSGSLYLWNNYELVDLSIFNDIVSVNDLILVECPLLSDLSGLQNIQTVNGIFRLGFNPSLTDLSAFSNISSVGTLDIYENQSLASLVGLENLTSVTETVYILDNPSLNDISALNNIDPNGLSELVIARNPNLAVCDNNFVCSVVFDSEISKQIQNNAVGCSSIPQVSASCILSNGSFDLEDSISLIPNPVSEFLTIGLSESIRLNAVSVFSSLGQSLFKGNASGIDFSVYSKGVYFIKIETDMGSVVRKVVKD